MINLILLTQKFSPYNKVGARRWSKFINYLQEKENLRIYVITQDYNLKDSNPWNIAIDREKVTIIYIKDLFSNIKNKSIFLDRIVSFIKYKLLGYTDDGSSFSMNAFKYLKQNHKNLKPHVIIASSPSYSTCYYASKYKKLFPHLKLINDFRDAWMDDFFSWNKSMTINDTVYNKQVYMEEFALNNCDAVVSVTPELIQKFKSKISNTYIKTELITNGYDKKDYSLENLVYPKEFNADKINICHFGTLDFGREEEFIKFIKTTPFPDKYNFFLIGFINDLLRKQLVNFKNCSFIPHLPGSSLNSYFYYSDFHLIVNDASFYYAYGSKIFDAMLYKKPIIYISKENSLVNKYKNNTNFLYSNNSKSSNSNLLDKINNYDADQYPINLDHDFDVEFLSERYYKLILELAS